MSDSVVPAGHVVHRNVLVLGQVVDHARWRVAENTVYLDPQHPSHIVLPVIPAEGNRGAR